MKRILIFSLQYYPLVGGAEVAIKEIVDRISPADIEFHMVTLRFGNDPVQEQIGNVVVHRIGGGLPAQAGGGYLSKILFIPRAAFAARSLHRAKPFDGLWAMMTYMVLPIVLLRWLRVSTPYVLTLQDGDPFERVFKRWYILPFRPLLRSGFRHARIVTVLSTYLATWGRRMGYPREPIVVPNGADVKFFSQEYPLQTIDEVKDALGKKMGDVFLITTSRLVHKNAVDDVISALPLLPGNVRFIVLGSGPEEAALKQLAQQLNVVERVIFLGFVEHKDMPKYLKASDIFIRPSRTEGFGASFPEAMAAGLPVIATQEGGIADFLFDEKRNPEGPITGWAVDRDSPQQIAEAVKAVMSNSEKVRRVIATAKAMVEEKYDWNLIAAQMREKAFEPLFKV